MVRFPGGGQIPCVAATRVLIILYGLDCMILHVKSNNSVTEYTPRFIDRLGWYNGGHVMLLNKINKSTLVQEKTLDAAWLRNDVLAHNIANVDTPLYNRKDVDFESYLKAALNSSSDNLIFHMKHNFRFSGEPELSSVTAKVTEDYNPLAMRIDGNNVDIDVEMAQMAKNTIKYNTVVSNVNSKFSRITHVISEGRK